jgi:cobalt/nickel transport system permease protein
MHISEGVLSAPVLLAGAGASLAGIAVGLKKMETENVPRVALLAAAFFIASLVHLPIGPANAHLILNGLMGFILGWAAFPAIFVGLTLQALLFQYGGITTLGVNTWNMAFPAVLCALLFSHWIRKSSSRMFLPAAFLCGFVSVALSGLCVAGCLIFSGEDFFQVAKIILVAHLPVMVVEGLVTAMICGFLRQVKPELLAHPGASSGEGVG